MEQINILEHNGYTVKQMWECDWNNLKCNLSNKKTFTIVNNLYIGALSLPFDGVLIFIFLTSN